MRILTIIALLALQTPAFAAPSSDIIGDIRSKVPHAIAIPSKKQPVAPVRDWTLMVWMSAKNNLNHSGMADLNEMESVGSTKKVNVIAQIGYHDTFKEKLSRTGVRPMDERKAKRSLRYIIKDNDPEKFTSPVIEKYLVYDMADSKLLEDFITWSKKHYPAKHYMLIVWNHGGGWTGISQDVNWKQLMDIPDMAKAVRKAGGVDVFATDACLMQMAEVLYEMRGTAKYIAGSEEVEPGLGYDYGALLTLMNQEKDLTPEKAAIYAQVAYVGLYYQLEKYLPKDVPAKYAEAVRKAKASGRMKPLTPAQLTAMAKQVLQTPVTSSVVDMAKFQSRMAPKVRKWIDALVASKDTKAALTAAANAHSFYMTPFKDFGDVVLTVTATTENEALRKAGIELLAAMKETIISNMAVAAKDPNSITGISVHFYPTDEKVLAQYRLLAWNKAMGWERILKTMNTAVKK